MIDLAEPPRCIVCGAAHTTCTTTTTTIPPLEGTIMASEQDKRLLDDQIAAAELYLQSDQLSTDPGFLRGAEDRLADLKRQRAHLDSLDRPAEVKPVTSDVVGKARRAAPEDKMAHRPEDKAEVAQKPAKAPRRRSPRAGRRSP